MKGISNDPRTSCRDECVCVCVCVYVCAAKTGHFLSLSLPDKLNSFFVLLLVLLTGMHIGYGTPRDSCTFPHHIEMNLPIPRDATSVATIMG